MQWSGGLRASPMNSAFCAKYCVDFFALYQFTTVDSHKNSVTNCRETAATRTLAKFTTTLHLAPRSSTGFSDSAALKCAHHLLLDRPLAECLFVFRRCRANLQRHVERSPNMMRRYTCADVLWFCLTHNPLPRQTKSGCTPLRSLARSNLLPNHKCIRTPVGSKSGT